MSDVTIKCTECQQDFIFSAGEQKYFTDRGLGHKPRRCADCRMVIRTVKAGRNVHDIHRAECEDCSGSFLVPFEPTGIKPVFCNPCLAERRDAVARLTGNIR